MINSRTLTLIRVNVNGAGGTSTAHACNNSICDHDLIDRE